MHKKIRQIWARRIWDTLFAVYYALRLALTLGVSLLGVLLLGQAHQIGSLLIVLMGSFGVWVCLARLRIRPLIAPELREASILILGTAIGSQFVLNTAIAGEIWVISLLAYVTSLAAMTFFGALILRRMGYTQPLSILCALPTTGLRSQKSAHTEAVQFVQHTRLVFGCGAGGILALALAPAILTTSFAWESLLSPPLAIDISFLLVACAFAYVFSWGLTLLYVPASALLGGLLAGGMLAAIELPLHWPPLLIFGSMLVLGAAGAKYIEEISEWKRFAKPMLSLVFAGLVMAGVLAAVLSLLTGLGFVQLFVAYAPGGAAIMTALSLGLGLEPGFVAVHHVLSAALLAGAFALYDQRESNN